MQTKTRELFTTIRTEGAILPADLLQRVAAGDSDLDGLTTDDYHLARGERLNEVITNSWNRLVGAWAGFTETRKTIASDNPGTTATRERWLLILFQELGYGRLQAAKAAELEGKSYPVSHRWGQAPIHLVGFNVGLDQRTRGVAGAAAQSPHGLLQEFLNRSDNHLWGFLSSGLLLRILRDNTSLTRQAHVEFDLAGMMDSEVFADFAVLWMLCHQSRVEAERPEECWLERWSQTAAEQGTRALEGLRQGVEDAINALGGGFLAHPANTDLKEALRSGELKAQDYYRQLLRLVYRLLFLFVAEDRELLHHSNTNPDTRERYNRYYSTRRLRAIAQRRRGTRHHDLYQSLRLVMGKLGHDDGCPPLGLPALGSFLWTTDAVGHLNRAELANSSLLEAIRSLAFTEQDKVLRAVDYKNLGSEELGSVYESLLELHPELNTDTARFTLGTADGHERKTTGSYYTPPALVQTLLDTALDPVLDEAATSSDPERAILDLKVCDPATGSGHFLIAAAHRIAKRLATARTGDNEPPPEAVRAALRDVIGQCIYGVDVNPMAVELCKVSLWMEALQPGKPLSFLDTHIKCGNSLLGTTKTLMSDGIPDSAFKRTEGDDNRAARELRRQNKIEREGQLTLEDAVPSLVEELEAPATALEAANDATVQDLKDKERLSRELETSQAYKRAKLAADTWCAAFLQQKTTDAPRLTTGLISRIATRQQTTTDRALHEIERLADQYSLFHWEIEFPQVFSHHQAGFDTVIGNPPWDRIKLQEVEWFASRDPELARAPTAAIRRATIRELRQLGDPLASEFDAAKQQANKLSHLVRSSDLYPLLSGGDTNLYSLFVEQALNLVQPSGLVSLLTPSDIYAGKTAARFFETVSTTGRAASLYDFENRRLGTDLPPFFPDVDSRFKFCALTLGGEQRRFDQTECAFFLHDTDTIKNPDRCFPLAPADFARANPNTRTAPVFRTRRDAEITLRIYKDHPVLVDRAEGEEHKTWPVRYHTMFHMTNDSHLFRTAAQLQDNGFYPVQGNRWKKGQELHLPLYEGKMVQAFDHRAASVVVNPENLNRPAQPREASLEQHTNPDWLPDPQFWVSADLIEWPDEPGWAVAFKDVTAPTNVRTMIAAVIPRSGVGNTLPLLLPDPSATVPYQDFAWLIGACMNSYVFDFIARQKVQGQHLNWFIVEQLPVIDPAGYDRQFRDTTARELVRDHVLRLTYTAHDMAPFAHDLDHNGPPFSWDEEERRHLQARLDALYFHLYNIGRDDADYILSTFPIVRRQDQARFGCYRTRDLILAYMNALAAGDTNTTVAL
ncbi:MAG: N-6 DNA methylase [Actinomycetia bacterium]|nr:N-6 DNA methylase [Actinomycetes bacterium]